MSDWPKTDAFLTAKGIRIAPPTPCSTDGAPSLCPMHAGGTTSHPTSWHYFGTARDYGDVASDCHAIADALRPFAQGDHHILNELFYAPTGDWWKDGRNLTRAAIGDHDDHVHASILAGHDFPTIPQEEPDMLIVLVPNGTGDAKGRAPVWETDRDGNMKNWNGAPFLKSLSAFTTDHPPIVAILPITDGSAVGVILVGDDPHQDGGEWVRSTYKITVGM